MSAISSTGISLSSFFQGVSVGSDAQTAQSAATSSTDSTASPQEVKGDHHHHHGGGGGGSFSKIEQAVTSALQSAQDDSSADPNSIIKDAISQVLQGSSQGSSPSATGSSTGASADANTNSTATDQAAGSNQSFTSMLQSLGVDPQQFHADFMSAVQAAQGGQVDPSTALQSFPPGTTIDTTA